MKITLPQFNLKYDKMVQPIDHFIHLLANHFIWRFVAYVDQHPDEEDSLGIVKENQMLSYHYVLPKASLGISSWFSNETEIWTISITSSCSETINLKFETESEMRLVESKIIEWLINGKNYNI